MATFGPNDFQIDIPNTRHSVGGGMVAYECLRWNGAMWYKAIVPGALGSPRTIGSLEDSDRYLLLGHFSLDCDYWTKHPDCRSLRMLDSTSPRELCDLAREREIEMQDNFVSVPSSVSMV